MTRCSEILLALLLLSLLAACASGPKHSSEPRRSRTAASTPAPEPAAQPTPPQASKGDPDQRFKAALKLMKEKKSKEAEAAFLGLARDFPAYSGPLTDLGILHAQARRRDQAIASLSEAVNVNAKNVIALNWLGILYRESGDFARSEKAYLKALEVNPDYAAARLNLGILYDVSLKRPRDALAQYRLYQEQTGGSNLIVGVWIKELDGTADTAVAGAAP